MVDTEHLSLRPEASQCLRVVRATQGLEKAENIDAQERKH